MTVTDSAYGGLEEANRLRAIHEAVTRPCCPTPCTDCGEYPYLCTACTLSCPCRERAQ